MLFLRVVKDFDRHGTEKVVPDIFCTSRIGVYIYVRTAPTHLKDILVSP